MDGHINDATLLKNNTSCNAKWLFQNSSIYFIDCTPQLTTPSLLSEETRLLCGQKLAITYNIVKIIFMSTGSWER